MKFVLLLLAYGEYGTNAQPSVTQIDVPFSTMETCTREGEEWASRKSKSEFNRAMFKFHCVKVD